MSQISFAKGTRAFVAAAAKTAGRFYVATDERTIYLDVDASTRIRLGDFQEYATLAALKQNPNPATTALYYITSGNILAKWNGTEYVQINPDTGATKITITGSGNVVTAMTYDENTRTITVTKGMTTMSTTDINAALDKKLDKKLDIGNESDLIAAKSYYGLYNWIDEVDQVSAGNRDALGKIKAVEGSTDGAFSFTDSDGKTTSVPIHNAATKSYVESAIAGVTQFNYQIVTALPSTGAKGVIYLMAHTHGDKDTYDEYIWVDNKFEKIGNTDIDLSGYQTKLSETQMAAVNSGITIAKLNTINTDIQANTANIAKKQDALAFDGTYNATSNKVATVTTVNNGVAAAKSYADSKIGEALAWIDLG